jgi:uncharacterized protein (TIRG00374 family)
MRNPNQFRYMRKRIIVGFLISMIFIYLLSRTINLGETITIIQNFGILSFFIGVLIYVVSFIFRSLRWNLILHPIKKISFSNTFHIIFISYFFNSILPARIGDLIRGYLLTLIEDIKFVTSFSTVIFDRTLDGITLIFLFCCSLAFTGLNINLDPRIKILIICIIILFMSLVLIYLLDFSLLSKLISPIQLISPKGAKILLDLLFHFKSGGAVLNFGKLMLTKLFITSLFIWIFEASLFYFVLFIIGIKISYSMLFLLLAIVNFTIMIPSAPGYIGTFETAFVLVLVFNGINNSVALSGALIIHIIWFFTTIVFGLVSMKLLGLHMKQIIDKVGRLRIKDD